jgi:hypothetical protein
MKKERTTENKKKMAELSPNINNIKWSDLNVPIKRQEIGSMD